MCEQTLHTVIHLFNRTPSLRKGKERMNRFEASESF
jgi:hypothetical protein